MADVKKRDLTMVPFSNLILREDFNIRTDMGDLRELADSIKENGVKQAMRGYKEKGTEQYIVVDGHRRYAACRLLMEEGSDEILIPFITEPQKYSDEQRVLDMFIMNDGKALNPLEQAAGVQRLLNWGWTGKDIAAKLGKSVQWIDRLSSLATAPKRIQKLVENKKMSATMAMDVVAKGEEETEKFLQNVDAGVYSANGVTAMNGEEVFVEDKPKRTKTKITKSDVELNSWQAFKKWAKMADPDKMSDEGARFFKYLCRMMNNEVGEASFKSFFSK